MPGRYAIIEVLRWYVLTLVAACYAPNAHPGAPCGTGGACPTGLRCSPASQTCELAAVDAPPLRIDARADGAKLLDAGPDARLGVYEAAILADLPVAYWRLGDPTSTMADRTGHGHTGTAMGGVTLGAPGLVVGGDQAINLDGSTGYVAVADAVDLRLTTAISLEAWIDAAAFDNVGGAPNQRMVHKGTTGNTGYALTVAQAGMTNSAFANVELEGLTTTALSGATQLLPSTVYDVVATWDGAKMRIYVNAMLDGEVAAAGAIPATTDPLDLGRRPDGARYWDGVLDEIAVYDYALTATQIAAHYNAGL